MGNKQELLKTIQECRDVTGVHEMRDLIQIYVDKWTTKAMTHPEDYPEYGARVRGMKQFLKDIEIKK